MATSSPHTGHGGRSSPPPLQTITTLRGTQLETTIRQLIPRPPITNPHTAHVTRPPITSMTSPRAAPPTHTTRKNTYNHS